MCYLFCVSISLHRAGEWNVPSLFAWQNRVSWGEGSCTRKHAHSCVWCVGLRRGQVMGGEEHISGGIHSVRREWAMFLL